VRGEQAYPCQRDPDLWFSDSPAAMEQAKNLCGDCPISQYTACRAAGWAHEYGVFGGLSHLDRQERRPRVYRDLVRKSRSSADRADRAIIVSRAASLVAGGVSTAEAARRLGVKAPTLRVLLARARAA